MSTPMLILEFIPMTPKWTSPSVPEGSATNGRVARPEALGLDFTEERSQLNEKYEFGYPSLYVPNATPFAKSLAIGTLIWSSRVNCLRSEPVWNAKKQMYFALQTGLDPKNFTRAKLV